MTNTTKLSLSLAALALAAGCQMSETPEKAQARMQAETDAARPLIAAQLARYVRAAASGNADSMQVLYTPDAVIMPPNKPAAVGHDAIHASFAAVGAFQVAFATRSLTVNGDVAVERGIWQARIMSAGAGMAVARDGKYLTHWHKVNGQWLMAEQIWNDDFKATMVL